MLMARHSIWEVAGIDQREFSALLILFRTVTGGRCSQKDENDDVPHDSSVSEGDASESDEEDAEDRSWASGRTELLTYQNIEYNNQLKQKFLDRLAEFVSPDKGGYFVTCSAIAEREEDVDIWLAKNTGFSEDEKLYLTERLAAQITAVATSSFANRSSSGNVEAESLLWESMTLYGVRIYNYYIPRLQEAYKAAIPLLQLPSSAVEDTYAQHELMRLLKPCEFFHKSTDSELSTRMITSCYILRGLKAVRTFLCGSNVSKEYQKSGRELWKAICFTGRLRAAYLTFCKAAERLPSFQNVKIHCVEKVAPDPEFISNPLSWQDALNALCIRVPNSKITLKPQGISNFNKWSKDSLSVHAEAQLLDAVGQQSNVLRYIGGSKRACFMCWILLCSAGFRARGCHDEIYSRWTMGDSENDNQDHLLYLAGILKAVERRLLTNFLELNAPSSHPKPQPSAGRTESDFQSGYVPVNRAGPFTSDQNCQVEERVVLESNSITTYEDRILPQAGRCFGCSCFTSRSCQICGDGWICSTACERQISPQHPSQCFNKSVLRSRNINCTICGMSNATKCNRCLSAAYCSQYCKDVDRDSHTLLCEAFEHVRYSRPQPSPRFKLAYLFPVTSKTPEFKWVYCERRRDDVDGISYDYPSVASLLGEDNPITERKSIVFNVVRALPLKRTVAVLGRDTSLIDGSKLNKSVVHGVVSQTNHTWNGPLVVMRQPNTNMDPLQYENVWMEDLRVALDYFVSYSEDYFEELHVYQPRPGANFLGVKINCKGDMRIYGRDQYENIRFFKHHIPRFGWIPSDLASLLGIPVLMRRCEPDR